MPDAPWRHRILESGEKGCGPDCDWWSCRNHLRYRILSLLRMFFYGPRCKHPSDVSTTRAKLVLKIRKVLSVRARPGRHLRLFQLLRKKTPSLTRGPMLPTCNPADVWNHRSMRGMHSWRLHIATYAGWCRAQPTASPVPSKSTHCTSACTQVDTERRDKMFLGRLVYTRNRSTQ